MRALTFTFVLILFSIKLVAQSNYIGNKAPLQETPFIALPLTSVKPTGWLQHQLILQKNGLTGNAEMLYKEDNNLGAGSDWLGGQSDSWERVPYYVKGLVPLAYILNDEELIQKALKWINWSLENQRDDGYFGPKNNHDWWCRMPMLYAVKDFYEATGDPRVIPFLTKYFKYQLETLDSQPLNEWGRSRAGDNIEVVFWLYNRTGDSFLLDLARKLKDKAYDWTDIFTHNRFMHFKGDFQTKHNVNVPQALKMPAIFYQLSKSDADKTSIYSGMGHLMRDHGQPHGMQSGNEMLNGRSSITGVETCSIVEEMQSSETIQMILGDPSFGDHLEKIAFNALPGSIQKDFKGHAYYTLSNQVICKHGNHQYGQQYDNGLLQGPYSGYPCCRYNLHMGWPYFVKNMWAATRDNGLAVLAYGPSIVKAKVGKGVNVEIAEKTSYPFEEKITLEISIDKETMFPLKLRIPEWCRNAAVKINGKIQSGIKKGTFYVIERNWKNHDKVELEFPMNVEVNDGFNNTVSVERGPLVYSLKIGEKWIARTDYKNGFAEHEILPTTPWNYGLEIDRENPEKSIYVNKGKIPADPFIQAITPVSLTVNARLIPEWKMNRNGLMAYDPPYGPVLSKEPVEKITLIPFGAEKLRITSFPLIGTPSLTTTEFTEDFNDGDQSGWVNYTGSFYVDKGEYVITSPEGGSDFKSIYPATWFTDFTYEAKIKLKACQNNAGLIFRANNVSPGTDAYDGYYAGVNPEGRIFVGKANGKWTELKSINSPVEIGEWINIKVIAKGDRISFFVDDMTTPKIEITDSTFKEGSVGVRAYEHQCRFDNLKVTKL